MNWTGIAAIPVLAASLGLSAGHAAGPAGQDDPGAQTAAVVQALPAGGLIQSGDQPVKVAGADGLNAETTPALLPAPAVPQSEKTERGAGQDTQVPSAEPLPRTPNQNPAASQPTRPAPAQRGAAGNQRGTAPGRTAAGTQKAAPKAAGATRPQDIQFDPQGMITLHTDELDVRQLLELMSRQSGLNILVSPKVSGNITANFEKISPDELLRSVLKLANLVEKVEGNVHFIYAKDELKDQTETKMKEKIVTKVYRLNYVRADEMMVMITPFLSVDVGRKRFSTTANYLFGVSEASTLSAGGLGVTGTGGMGTGMAGMGMAGAGMAGAAAPGGAGTVQRGTQPATGGLSLAGQDVLVIQDYESNLKIIDQIVEKIDVPPVQVLIEAVIISVQLTKDKQLGVNFAVVDNLGRQLGTIGTGFQLNSNVGFNPAQVLTAAGKIATGAATGAAGAAAAVIDPNGFASDSNGIKYGFISNNVTGFVRAIETLGSTKVLASPRILVLNKQRAEIQLGSRLGFKSITTQNYIGTTQGIQFLNTGTLLRLRPFVSDDGMIRMEIHPERSTGSVDATTGLPSAQTAELTTNVMVPNGTTLVIGGLMEDEDDYLQQGLPGLSRVPLLGALFGLKDKLDQRRELVVLLTPHVWTDHLRTGQPLEVSDRSGDHSTPPPERDQRESSTAAAVAGEPAANPASSAGIGLAAAPSAPAETPKPMAAKTGWWDRERGWFRDRRSRPAASPPVTAAPMSASAVTDVRQADSPRLVAARRPAGAAPEVIHEEQAPTPAAAAARDERNDPGATFELMPAPAPVPAPGNGEGTPTPGIIDPVVAQNREFPQSRANDPALQPAAAQRASAKPPPSREPERKPGPRRHVVQAGESFATIAKVFYGSEQHASLLWWANRDIVPWPEALKPGTTIVVPPLQQIAEDRLAASSSRQSRLATRPAPAQPGPPAPFPLSVTKASPRRSGRALVDSQVTPAGFQPVRSQSRPVPAERPGDSVKGGGYAIHIVRRSETLRSIARERLGDERRVAEIAELNRDLLSASPRLTAGQRLLLPGDARPLRTGP